MSQVPPPPIDNDGEAAIKWTPLKLLHMEYPEGDKMGHVLAWFSMSPFFIFAGMVTLILFRRDLHTISFTVGQLINEVFNLILKRIIKEPRPQVQHTVHLVQHGMPSSHAQFIWFFSAYYVLFIIFRVVEDNHKWWKPGMSLGATALATVVTYSRVYLGYHTTAQVMWGSGIGIGCAILWFVLTQKVLTPLFPTIAASSIAEFFLIRDTTLIPNLLIFEYTTSRAEAWKRLKRSEGKKRE